jgi:hypothetical protein
VKEGSPDDGSECTRETAMQSRLEAAAIRVVVPKPGTSQESFVLKLEVDGEADLAIGYTFSSVLLGVHAQQGKEDATPVRAGFSNGSFGAAFGTSLNFFSSKQADSMPALHTLVGLDSIRSSRTLQHSFQVQLSCGENASSIACPADGDLIETTITVQSKNSDPIVATSVKIVTEVQALPSCQHSVATFNLPIDAPILDGAPALWVTVLAIDADGMDITRSNPTITLRWTFENRTELILLQRQAVMPPEFRRNVFFGEVAPRLRAAAGSYGLEVVLQGAWDGDHPVADCIVKQGVLEVVEKGSSNTWIMVGALIAFVLFFTAVMIYVKRNYYRLRVLFVKVFSEFTLLSVALGGRVGNLGTDILSCIQINSMDVKEQYRIAIIVATGAAVVSALCGLYCLIDIFRRVWKQASQIQGHAPGSIQAFIQQVEWESRFVNREMYRFQLIFISIFMEGKTRANPLGKATGLGASQISASPNALHGFLCMHQTCPSSSFLHLFSSTATSLSSRVGL